MLDNIDIAILTKLNDLAERYSLKPYDFVATVQPNLQNGKTEGMTLTFEVSASGNALREERFDKMLKAIGVNEDGLLVGTDTTIIDSLDTALQLSPKQRQRF